MRPKFINIMLLAFLSTGASVLSGCDESLIFANIPPGELKITKNRCYLGPGDVVTLAGQATDRDGDEISYSWTAETGTFSPADGAGQVVTWQAPGGHGTFRVTLKATDGIDDASKGVDIDVGRNLDISQTVNNIEQTDYPYIVQDNLPLGIGAGVTVRLEAGVTVVFSEVGGGFEVGGTLIVNGTEEDRVLLVSSACANESRPWKGVRFFGEQAAGDLRCLTITSANDGLTVENGAVVTADDIIVDQSSGEGIAVKNGGRLTLSNSRVWDNGAGIYVANGIMLLQDTSIRDNGNYGISMLAYPGTFDVTVTGCVIANNWLDGIVLGELAKPVVNNCALYWNGEGRGEYRALNLSAGYSNVNTIDMTGNYWGVTTETEIERQIILNGAGVTVDYTGWLEEPPAQD